MTGPDAREVIARQFPTMGMETAYDIADRVAGALESAGLLLPPGPTVTVQHAVKVAYALSGQTRYMPAGSVEDAVHVAAIINQGDVYPPGVEPSETATPVMRTVRTYPTGTWTGLWEPIDGEPR